MENIFGISQIRPFEEKPDVAKFRALGWKVFYLRGAISGKVDFFDSIKSCGLPFDPPLEGAGNWDALEDSLGGALMLSNLPGFLVVWTGFESFMQRAPKEWDAFIAIFSSLAEETRKINVLLVSEE